MRQMSKRNETILHKVFSEIAGEGKGKDTYRFWPKTEHHDKLVAEHYFDEKDESGALREMLVLSYTYVLNGDVMSDPAMFFDRTRNEDGSYEYTPTSYLNNTIGVVLEPGVNGITTEDLFQFCETWMEVIELNHGILAGNLGSPRPQTVENSNEL